MTNPSTRRFWAEQLKANRLPEAIAQHPVAARRFFGELALAPERVEDLAAVAYAHYRLSLTDRELLRETAPRGRPGGGMKKPRRPPAFTITTYVVLPLGAEGPAARPWRPEGEPLYARAYSDPRVEALGRRFPEPRSARQELCYQRELARATLRAAGLAA